MLKVKFSDGKEVTKRFTAEAAEGEQSQATTQTGKTVAAKTKATAKTGRVAGVKTGDSADLYRCSDRHRLHHDVEKKETAVSLSKKERGAVCFGRPRSASGSPYICTKGLYEERKNVYNQSVVMRGIGAAGSAFDWQSRGQGFDPPMLHQDGSEGTPSDLFS